MRNSKNKNLIIPTTNTSNSNCFTSILQRFTCGGDLPSPTPSDRNHHHHIFSSFKSNGCIHPNPNELPESEPGSTSSHSLDHRQPGLVARLMGLESMPSCPNLGLSSQDSILNLRSKSLNSLHLYIFPDTFLDHVSPSPTSQLLCHQRRKPCHRRVQTSSSILCLDPLPVKAKLEADSVVGKPERRRRNGELLKPKKVVRENEMNMNINKNKKIGEKGFENKVNASKCKVTEDHRTRKCRSLKKDDLMKGKSNDSKRKEIKYTRLRKEKRVCSETKNGATSKDCSSSRPRRRSSRKIIMEQHDETYQGLFQCHDPEENLMSFRGKKLRSRTRTRTRTDMEDWLEMMDQVCRLVEECVRGDVWDEFDENVKEFGVDIAGQMLDVLIDQFLHELIG